MLLIKKCVISVLLIIVNPVVEPPNNLFAIPVQMDILLIMKMEKLNLVMSLVKQEPKKNVYLVIQIIIYVKHVMKAIIYQMLQLIKKFAKHALKPIVKHA